MKYIVKANITTFVALVVEATSKDEARKKVFAMYDPTTHPNSAIKMFAITGIEEYGTNTISNDGNNTANTNDPYDNSIDSIRKL